MNELSPSNANLPIGYQRPAMPGYPNPDYARSGDPYYDPFEDENSFDPLKLLWFVVHYRWLIAAFILAGLVTGFVITYLQTPLYRASSKVEILTTGAKVIQDLEVITESSGIRAFQTAQEKMRSRELARRVAFELNLSEQFDFLAPTPGFSLTNLVARIFGVDNKSNIRELSAEKREALAARIVRKNFSVKLIKKHLHPGSELQPRHSRIHGARFKPDCKKFHRTKYR